MAEAEGKIINLSRERLMINRVVKEIGNHYIPRARKKDINFMIDIPDKELYIDGDRDSIEQIFSNLLSNSIKYTDRGGRVEFSIRDQGELVRVKIRDTGIGIASQDLPYIFERFYRTDKSRSSRTGGVGIGLTITRELVEAHSGKISVESEPGKGTTFIILLPLSHNF